MGLSYLGNKEWCDITRDERTFCMYLYQAFRQSPEFLLQLIKDSTKNNDFGLDMNFDSNGDSWELGYEVVFYRDLMFDNNKPIRENLPFLKDTCKIDEPKKLIKRTFDLCLFSEKEIIIIEAKAAQGLDKDQYEDFKADKDRIQKLIPNLLNDVKEAPHVKLVLLASSNYLTPKSQSYKRSNGTLRSIINELELSIRDTSLEKPVDGFLSWEKVFRSLDNYEGDDLDKKMIRRADNPNKNDL